MECRLPEVVVRPLGAGVAARYPAAPSAHFMNRRMRNRTYGGVGGRPGNPVPYPIRRIPAQTVNGVSLDASVLRNRLRCLSGVIVRLAGYRHGMSTLPARSSEARKPLVGRQFEAFSGGVASEVPFSTTSPAFAMVSGAIAVVSDAFALVSDGVGVAGCATEAVVGGAVTLDTGSDLSPVPLHAPVRSRQWLRPRRPSLV